MFTLCDIDSRSIDDIWNHSINDKVNLKALNFGCRSLDSSLGGILAGEIIEFYGDSSCGKTQISLTIIANTLIQHYLENIESKKIILIYTHNVPPLDRIKSIISNKLHLLQINDSGNIVDKLLKQLLISTPRDYREFYRLITEDIFAIQVSDKNITIPNLLVIDSISLIRRIEHGEAVKKHSEFICSVSRHLKKFAHERSCAIVITNQIKYMSNIDEISFKAPVLGTYWARSINTRVYLQRNHICYKSDSEYNKKLAKIMFSSKSLQRCNDPILFTIGPLGVQDCPD